MENLYLAGQKGVVTWERVVGVMVAVSSNQGLDFA